jgi:hypothetical protein
MAVCDDTESAAAKQFWDADSLSFRGSLNQLLFGLIDAYVQDDVAFAVLRPTAFCHWTSSLATSQADQALARSCNRASLEHLWPVR